ncbi:MAG TPA: helix-hairpin-helix domain-containing protein [Phycisphaerae bacterium]|jgi:hypothetical protein
MSQPEKSPLDESPPASEGWGWTRRQRMGLGVLLTLLIAVLTIQFIRRPARVDDPVTILRGQSVALPQKIDPNTASLQELSRIPHIGEILGQKIIDYREARKAMAAGGVVFRQAADLDAVPGIGKKLIEQLSPFLQFPEDNLETQP